MEIYTIIGIALWALVPGFIAKKKCRSFWGYYFLSFLISPLITIIIALCVSDKTCAYYAKHPPDYRPGANRSEASATNPLYANLPVADDRVLFCRKCGEKLMADSQFCHKCGSETKIPYANRENMPPVVSGEPNTFWICEKCKTKNLSTRNDCWSCKAPKRTENT